MTGFPCSGKTHRAQQLIDEFAARISSSATPSPKPKSIVHIPAQHSTLDGSGDSQINPRDQIYNAAAAEKNARAAEFSAIKRALSKETLVIADGLNYIKGYRYQLWCEAKAVGTRCCVVHVAAREDECRRWNEERLRAHGRGAEVDAEAEDANSGGKAAGFGDLMPESHTALYGDRTDFEPRSRSSSIDVELEDKPAPAPTLKSLYLRDDKPDLKDPVPPSLASLTLKDKDDDRPTEPTPTLPPLPPPTSCPPYSPSTLTSLTFRYEPPSPFTRWDTPLFTLPSTDPHPPYSLIWTALYPPPAKPSKRALAQGTASNPAREEADVVKPHAATVLPPSSSTHTLQILEKTTAEVTTALFAAYNDAHLADNGGQLLITLPPDIELAVEVPTGLVLTQAMLQRLRRKFAQVQRGGLAHGQGSLAGRREVAGAFGRFLEGEWE